jgi:glycerol uptake facilitator protein
MCLGAPQAFFAEFVGTFIHVITVFVVTHRNASARFAGVAIGSVMFTAIIPVAPTTAATINPARTFGPTQVQQLAEHPFAWGQLPMYPRPRSSSPVSPPPSRISPFPASAMGSARPYAVPSPQTTTAA